MVPYCTTSELGLTRMAGGFFGRTKWFSAAIRALAEITAEPSGIAVAELSTVAECYYLAASSKLPAMYLLVRCLCLQPLRENGTAVAVKRLE